MSYNRKQEIVQIAIDKIKPYPGNPRINEQAVPALMENIRKMGFRNPLYLAPDLTIIAGHTRLKAARPMVMPKVSTFYKVLNTCKYYTVIGREENPTNGSVRTMANFEIGKTYFTRSICDNNMIFKVRITKRTEKTVTIEGYRNKRCKVHIDKDGDEFIVPESYSMAPTFRASREVA